MDSQQKPAEAKTGSPNRALNDPAFGVTCPAPGGTVGTTSLVAYGWCANLPSYASHTIKCKVEKTTGMQFDPIPQLTAEFYCGETPTLWSIEIGYPATAAGDVLKLTATFSKSDGSDSVSITRGNLTPDSNASTPIPTECPVEEDELEIDTGTPTLPGPMKAVAATAPSTGQSISFEFTRQRLASYAYARVSRKNAAGAIVRVLRIIPAELRHKICRVRVPRPKNANPPGGDYYVADVFIHRDTGTVLTVHSEVLSRSRS